MGAKFENVHKFMFRPLVIEHKGPALGEDVYVRKVKEFLCPLPPARSPLALMDEFNDDTWATHIVPVIRAVNGRRSVFTVVTFTHLALPLGMHDVAAFTLGARRGFALEEGLRAYVPLFVPGEAGRLNLFTRVRAVDYACAVGAGTRPYAVSASLAGDMILRTWLDVNTYHWHIRRFSALIGNEIDPVCTCGEWLLFRKVGVGGLVFTARVVVVGVVKRVVVTDSGGTLLGAFHATLENGINMDEIVKDGVIDDHDLFLGGWFRRYPRDVLYQDRARLQLEQLPVGALAVNAIPFIGTSVANLYTCADEECGRVSVVYGIPECAFCDTDNILPSRVQRRLAYRATRYQGESVQEIAERVNCNVTWLDRVPSSDGGDFVNDDGYIRSLVDIIACMAAALPAERRTWGQVFIALTGACGSGKTVSSRALACQRVESGRRVLYISTRTEVVAEVTRDMRAEDGNVRPFRQHRLHPDDVHMYKDGTEGFMTKPMVVTTVHSIRKWLKQLTSWVTDSMQRWAEAGETGTWYVSVAAREEWREVRRLIRLHRLVNDDELPDPEDARVSIVPADDERVTRPTLPEYAVRLREWAAVVDAGGARMTAEVREQWTDYTRRMAIVHDDVNLSLLQSLLAQTFVVPADWSAVHGRPNVPSPPSSEFFHTIIFDEIMTYADEMASTTIELAETEDSLCVLFLFAREIIVADADLSHMTMIRGVLERVSHMAHYYQVADRNAVVGCHVRAPRTNTKIQHRVGEVMEDTDYYVRTAAEIVFRAKQGERIGVFCCVKNRGAMRLRDSIQHALNADGYDEKTVSVFWKESGRGRDGKVSDIIENENSDIVIYTTKIGVGCSIVVPETQRPFDMVYAILHYGSFLPPRNIRQALERVRVFGQLRIVLSRGEMAGLRKFNANDEPMTMATLAPEYGQLIAVADKLTTETPVGLMRALMTGLPEAAPIPRSFTAQQLTLAKAIERMRGSEWIRSVMACICNAGYTVLTKEPVEEPEAMMLMETQKRANEIQLMGKLSEWYTCHAFDADDHELVRLMDDFGFALTPHLRRFRPVIQLCENVTRSMGKLWVRYFLTEYTRTDVFNALDGDAVRGGTFGFVQVRHEELKRAGGGHMSNRARALFLFALGRAIHPERFILDLTSDYTFPTDRALRDNAAAKLIVRYIQRVTAISDRLVATQSIMSIYRRLLSAYAGVELLESSPGCYRLWHWDERRVNKTDSVKLTFMYNRWNVVTNPHNRFDPTSPVPAEWADPISLMCAEMTAFDGSAGAGMIPVRDSMDRACDDDDIRGLRDRGLEMSIHRCGRDCERPRGAGPCELDKHMCSPTCGCERGGVGCDCASLEPPCWTRRCRLGGKGYAWEVFGPDPNVPYVEPVIVRPGRVVRRRASRRRYRPPGG